MTPALTFESNRPPGTQQLGVVIAATEMEVTQTWLPESIDALSAGDVIQRTITRRASGTTAMMMTPIAGEAPDGVRVYVGDPIVQDRTDRGSSTAERVDTIKYQFERAGTFTIPATTIIWWDAGKNDLKQESMDGKTVSVRADASTLADADVVQVEPPITGWLFAFAMAACAIGGLIFAIIYRRRVRPVDPEAETARRLLAACRSCDAQHAYAAFLAWKRVVIDNGKGRQLEELMHGDGAEFGSEIEGLSRRLFSASVAAEPWSGAGLAATFTATRRILLHEHRALDTDQSLPLLNPR